MGWATWTTAGVYSGHAGVHTVEGGVLKGEVTVHTTWVGQEAIITVQYSGAADWCTLADSPVPCASERESRELHQAVVDAVRTGAAINVPTAA
ncbi:MAG TPA: hypothetical protein VL551_33440 [Actinospica sp.]|nr:hypothetical protein [Actinospica sp.]